MRSRRGITLVSLVVTIIILIILAGVSINLTLGENGLITMAKKARENMELAQVDEQTKLNNLYDQIVAEGGVAGNTSNEDASKLAEFKKEIASAITDMGIETEENADVSTMASNIRSLTGESSADKVSYDNTNSELTSTNVQGAVDEIDTKIENLNGTINSINPWIDSGVYTGETNTLTFSFTPSMKSGVYEIVLKRDSSLDIVTYGIVRWNGSTILSILNPDYLPFSINNASLTINGTGWYARLYYRELK